MAWDMTLAAVSGWGKYTPYTISENEIGFLVLHIGVGLERRYISMAVAIGMPSCFSTSSACCLTVGFTRRLSVIVFSMVITSGLL